MELEFYRLEFHKKCEILKKKSQNKIVELEFHRLEFHKKCAILKCDILKMRFFLKKITK